MQISSSARIGKNLRIHHIAGIVVGTYVTIGENCHVYQGVCLGQSNGLSPTKDVTFCPYSCVLGVYDWDNSIVLAHSLVTHDAPSNCLVAGIPAVIFSN